MELERKDIEKLIEKYQVGKLINFNEIKQGWMNYMYVILTDRGKFILRIAKKTKKEKDILFEINLVNSLSGLPTTKYIKDKKGKFINKFKGHNYMMYRYLEGDMPKKISKKIFKQLAYFLGEFHNQTKNFDINQDRFSWYTFPDKRAKEFEKYLLNKIGDHKKEINYLKSELLKSRLPANLPTGPIHCDVKRNNIIVVGNKLIGVVDFDNCQIGPYLLDLGICILWSCTNNKGMDYKKARKFIKYYQKFRKLSEIEKKYLFQSIKYAYISHVFVDYYVFAKNIIDEDYFNFSRKFFLPAIIKLDERKFAKYVK